MKRLAEKVLLIGWDAADWLMIRPLIDQGLMPTLASLIEDGVSGNLATIRPILSPMLWNSIATGKRADKHGICGFAEPLPDGSGIRPVTSTSRKTKAIWNILSQNGLNSNVVGWFASHPAEPIRGAVVSDYYVHPPAPGQDPDALPPDVCHPERLIEPMAKLRVKPRDIDAQAILSFVTRAAEIDGAKDDRLRKLATLLMRTSSIQAAACALMAKEPWDFMAVYYDAIDQFGHHFMPYHPPAVEGISELDAEIFKDVMVNCYRFHDMMLESLLNNAGEDATVILVSDHGFHSGSERTDTDGFKDPTSWHRPFGVVCAKGPGFKKNDSLYGACLLDVTPTILSLFGLPVGEDMDGRPWLEAFDEETRPERVKSWDLVDGECGMHSEDRREDPVEAAEALRHLVDLGYIEPPSEDVQQTVQNTTIDLKTNLALALSDSNRLEQSLPIWQELVELCADDPAKKDLYLAHSACCHLQLDHAAECASILDQLNGEMGQSPFVQLMRVRLAEKNRQPDEALRLAREVLDQCPDDTGILNRVGQLLLDSESWDDAESVFRRSLSLLEENPMAHDGLAAVHLERDSFGDAIEHSLLAVGLIHYFPSAHYHLGVALHGDGREEQAIAAFETCLAMRYRLKDAHYRLAVLYRSRDPLRANRHQELAGL
ncbi:Type I phosphodiesterase / nucleotide pyrophosphatase [Posidoniimonas polymericola]|uniref:Type I phosphodiesterase / nucleotide pyrophosphatase n=1 Tax=Posidoniimonas polymericola TaxID=2528002 RepID=A0A5C5YH97_9BACT|nr:alkaline phosphatase family protein [Posidoniimonas polymericola]TWT74529.1 Type I phosphodiesterase / nucleotide pyrophosphatase [Posidoniimonas polymericola]